MRATNLAALIALGTVSLTALPALAQSDGPPAQPAPAPGALDNTITVGAALAYLPDYDGSDDYRFVPAPAALGAVKGFQFQVIGNRASVDLFRDPADSTIDIQVGPVGVVNFNRTSIDNIDDRRVRALGELDTAIELGGYVGIGKTGVITSPYDKVSFSVSYRHDVSGVHKSGIWSPTINYFTPLSLKSAVLLVASAEHVERDYGRTYYDVTAAGSVASGLPVYRTDGGWRRYTLGIGGTYALTGNLLHGLKLIAGGTYSRMLGDYGDSPLVSIAGSRNQWLGAVGLGYTF